MDNDLKTVGGVPEDNSLSLVDPLLKEQHNQVSQMRDIILSFDHKDSNSVRRAMGNITVLRIYHQVGRIIHATEIMDALEDKLYDSIISNIGQMDSFDPATMMTLLKVQSQLQENMIQSQLLLKPYMEMDVQSLLPEPEMEETSFGVSVISQESRNNIRTGAQALLTELRKANPELPQGDMKAINEESDDRSADSE
jgi:hypothetical protein